MAIELNFFKYKIATFLELILLKGICKKCILVSFSFDFILKLTDSKEKNKNNLLRLLFTYDKNQRLAS